MRIRFLDVGASYAELRDELDAAYHSVMESGWYVLGNQLRQFEAEFSALCGVRYAVGVGNGLDALTLALRALGVGAGAEVVVPTNTFIATWLAVSMVGAKPVPVEPEVRNHLIDPEEVARAITPRTRAVLPVHLFGQTADMPALRDIASTHGVHLLEDAAQAHGAVLHNVPAGGFGEAAAFSFYPGKNLGAYGDGGAVVTNDEALADTVRALANYGSRQKYDHAAQGVNSRLDELQAGFLRVRLRHLADWNDRRRHIANYYLDKLRGLPELELPEVSPDAVPVWHLFVIRHPRRDELQAFLAERGIETLIHYPVPPHLSGAYAQSGYRAGDFPIAEALARTVLSLPIGPHMDLDQADCVVGAVVDFCTKRTG